MSGIETSNDRVLIVGHDKFSLETVAKNLERLVDKTRILILEKGAELFSKQHHIETSAQTREKLMDQVA